MATMTETPVQLTRGRLDEQLATHAARLARRNQALDDFAGLVAHDVRSSLVAALKHDDPYLGIERSLELVESILDAVRAERAYGESVSFATCARQAIDDLGADEAMVVVAADGPFPIPADALRVILRNLFANSIAAGAQWIYVTARVGDDGPELRVDDDGCGLDSTASYREGTGLGLGLCRRLLDRFDSALQLASGPGGGTRATIVVPPWA
jgi:signal transduction histidine kinase